jgi:hypothetical protein
MANIPDCTLTTACYLLSDFSPKARTIEQTISDLDALLHIPCYLVIYCNKYTEQYIRNIREKYKLESLTKIIVVEFQDLWCYQFRDKLTENKSKSYAIKCERSFVERCLFFINKYDFVLNTINDNPFNTSKFGWIDCNLNKDGTKLCENNFDNLLLSALKNAPNKFHLTIQSVEDKKYKLDENKREFYSIPRWVTVGSFFTTPSDIGIRILKRLKELTDHTINLGYGDGDEHYYLEILDEFYDDIYRSYGDYRDTLHNFLKPVKNPDFILWNVIIKYFNFGYYRECIDACYSVISAFENFDATINNKIPDMSYFVRIYSILYKSLQNTNNNQAEIVANSIRNYYHKNPIFKYNFDCIKYQIGLDDFNI